MILLKLVLVLNLMEVADRIIFDVLKTVVFNFCTMKAQWLAFYLLILENIYWLLLLGCCHFVENTPSEFFDLREHHELVSGNIVLAERRQSLFYEQ